MNNRELKEILISGISDKSIVKIYGEYKKDRAKERILIALEKFTEIFGEKENLYLISAPGRTEICGNHTDHNCGLVITGAIDLDIIGIVAKTTDNIITIKSDDYPIISLDLTNLEMIPEEQGCSIALIRGIAYSMKQRGYNIGGFTGYMTSEVLQGSGLSSSAAFEVLICNIFSHLYNEGTLSAVDAGIISQESENNYFNKPCGLMDQMASSVGNIISIDFNNPTHPIIKEIDFDFSKANHKLCIIDTGGSHQNLTDDYTAITQEMKSIAQFFGKENLSECNKTEVMKNLKEIRETYSDRGILRAIHFFDECERVKKMIVALENDDFEFFLDIVKLSGQSSYELLQNIYSNQNYKEQGVAIGLMLCNNLLGKRGAYRVHGGGFAGTIQAYIPNDLVETFKLEIETVFGENSCHILQIRQGAIRIY